MTNNEEIIKNLSKLERSSKLAIPLSLFAFFAIAGMLYISTQELKDRRSQIAQADIELNNKRTELITLKKTYIQVVADTQARLLELDKKIEAASTTTTPSEQAERLLAAREEIAVTDASLTRATVDVNKHKKINDSAVYSTMNIDVFYCEKKQATSLPIAQEILTLKESGDVGRWRVRPLPESINKQPGYKISSSEIRFTPPEETAGANSLLRKISSIGVRVSLRETSYPTPGYVSIFICQ